jgi:hypothetical protein
MVRAVRRRRLPDREGCTSLPDSSARKIWSDRTAGSIGARARPRLRRQRTAGAGRRIGGQARAHDPILELDPTAGMMRAEAGPPRDLAWILPSGAFRRWFPRTQFYARRHGRRRRPRQEPPSTARSSRDSLRLLTAGEIVDCSQEQHSTLRRPGETGPLVASSSRLAGADPSPGSSGDRAGERIPRPGRARSCGRAWPLIGWIDCLAGGSALGRRHLLRGRWAKKAEAPHSGRGRSANGDPVPPGVGARPALGPRGQRLTTAHRAQRPAFDRPPERSSGPSTRFDTGTGSTAARFHPVPVGAPSTSGRARPERLLRLAASRRRASST